MIPGATGAAKRISFLIRSFIGVHAEPFVLAYVQVPNGASYKVSVDS